MASYTAYSSPRVKGGMPVDATASVYSDRDGMELTDIQIFWSGSTRLVTDKFLASLSKADWETIEESLCEA